MNIIKQPEEDTIDGLDHWEAFESWREDVDQDKLLDTWTLAFAYFSGRGVEFDAALQMAEEARNIEEMPQSEYQKRVALRGTTRN